MPHLGDTFGPAHFPATRDELVKAAEEAAADEQVVAELRGLPPGPYDDVDDLEQQVRAARLAADVGEENPDPITRREAIEQALESEDLSDEGESLGDAMG